MKTLEQLDAELTLWETRRQLVAVTRQNANVMMQLMDYQEREIERELAAAQGEKVRAEAEIKAGEHITGE